MSRSGYSDDCDDEWALIRWRGAVASAIRGARGQALLRELAEALDAMPRRELVANEFVADGRYCALGVVAASRGIDPSTLDLDDRSSPAHALNIAEALAAEIMFINDDYFGDVRWKDVEVCGPVRQWERHRRLVREAPTDAGARRWNRVRAWVASQLKGRP